MSTDGRPRSPQSWEHLLEKDPHTGTGFRLGIMAAVLIHAGIFAITWPTVAQAPPNEPDEVFIPFPITTLAPPEREPELIPIEIPPQRSDSPIIPGPPEVPAEPIDRPVTEVIEIPDGRVEYIPEPVDLAPTAEVEETTIVFVGVDIDEPRIIHKVEPRYTQPAIRGRIQGAVILDLIIDTEGRVESVQVLRGLPLGLTKSAVDAVEQWEFAASIYRDRPVSVRYILTVHFNLK